MRYIALIEKDAVAYGAYFPQFPGCVAMADSLDGVIANARSALAEWIEDEARDGRDHAPEDVAILTTRDEVAEALGTGAVLAYVPLVRERGRPMRADLSLDAGLLDDIDDAAKRAGLTRSAWIASAARMALAQEA